MIKKILNVFDSIEETDPDYGPLVISESFFLNFCLFVLLAEIRLGFIYRFFFFLSKIYALYL